MTDLRTIAKTAYDHAADMPRYHRFAVALASTYLALDMFITGKPQGDGKDETAKATRFMHNVINGHHMAITPEVKAVCEMLGFAPTKANIKAWLIAAYHQAQAESLYKKAGEVLGSGER